MNFPCDMNGKFLKCAPDTLKEKNEKNLEQEGRQKRSNGAVQISKHKQQQTRGANLQGKTITVVCLNVELSSRHL